MPCFNYVALDTRGQEATGMVEAPSSNAAITQLRQAGYFPTSVIEEAIVSTDGQEARQRAAKMARMTKPRAKKGLVLFERKKVKSKILMIFTRQLATLIDSGLPLLRSLNVLTRQERDPVLKRTTEALADSVQSGNTFSDALAQHPKIFNELYISMVKAGELGGVVALIFGIKLLARTPGGRSLVDQFKLRLPLFGDLIRKTAISRFARTLGTLVTSGVSILQALNITRDTAGNTVIANAISQVHDRVKEGESIVQPLETSGAFPPMVVSMIDVGEETGQLPDMLLKIADVYDGEVDNSVAALTSILEPLMIVFLAVVVGTIVIALFLPLISIITTLQQQT